MDFLTRYTSYWICILTLFCGATDVGASILSEARVGTLNGFVNIEDLVVGSEIASYKKDSDELELISVKVTALEKQTIHESIHIFLQGPDGVTYDPLILAPNQMVYDFAAGALVKAEEITLESKLDFFLSPIVAIERRTEAITCISSPECSAEFIRWIK